MLTPFPLSPCPPPQIPAELITLDPGQLQRVDTATMEQKRAERVERLVGGCGGSSAGGAEGFRVTPHPFIVLFSPFFPGF